MPAEEAADIFERGAEEEEEERERGLQGGTMAADVESEGVGERRPLIKKEIELQRLMREHDDDDPMKEYLVQEKKEEVVQALARLRNGGKEGKRRKEHKHKHHHHSHRHDHREGRRSDADGEKDDPRRPGHGNRRRDGHRRRSRSP